MNESEAIDRVRDYVEARYQSYPLDELVARRFDAGWSVFAPVVVSPNGSIPTGRRVFLIGDNGDMLDTSSSIAPSRRVQVFHERFG